MRYPVWTEVDKQGLTNQQADPMEEIAVPG